MKYRKTFSTLQVARSGPLMASQRRLWFVQRLNPHSCAYNVPLAFDVEGVLNLAVLKNAISRLTARHEILRTVFRENPDGEPLQVVLDSWSPYFEFRDFSAAANAELLGMSFLKEEIARPFRLDVEPPIRVLVAALRSDRHLILILLHHILVDQPSQSILIRDIIEGYNQLLLGTVSGKREEPTQCIDYALLQKSDRRMRVADAHLAFWIKRLAGKQFGLMLTQECPTRTGAIVTWHQVIAASLSSKTRCAARRLRVTLFTWFLSVLHLFVSKLTNVNGSIIACFVSGREDDELTDTVGFFVNTLPFCISHYDSQSLQSFFNATQAVVFEALKHHSASFDSIVAAIDEPRNGDRVNVAFNYLTSDGQENISLSGTKVSPIIFPPVECRFDLALTVRDDGKNLTLLLEADSGICSSASLAQWMNTYNEMLTSVLTNLDLAIEDFRMLGQDLSETNVSRKLLPKPDDYRDSNATEISNERIQEVRRVLNEHTYVLNCDVFEPQSVDEPACLIAYVVPKTLITAQELVAYCNRELPSLAIRIKINFVKTLSSVSHPFTTGDLAVIDLDGSEIYESVEPSDRYELAIAAIFAEALGVDKVNRLENFFYLGGHSMLGAKVVRRIQASFGVALTMREFFSYPTVAGVAYAVRRHLSPEQNLADA